MPEAGNGAGVKMRFIEIIRGHKWERLHFFNNAKRFQCKRCGIGLEVRTLRDKRWRDIYITDWKILGFKNVYLLDNFGVFAGGGGLYTYRSETSKEYGCRQRVMGQALR